MRRETLVFIVYAISLVLLWIINPLLIPAMILFGWAMNMENRNRENK